jgi:Cof subfamily protein (haloacid dehalogenase superfamily)
LIAFDYDGTLVNGLEAISPRTKKALTLAHQKGAILTLVTGRPLTMVPPEVFALPFSYAITANGARTDDLAAKKTLALFPIGRELALEIMDEVAASDVSLTAFINGRSISDRNILMMKQGRAVGTFWQKLNWFVQFIEHSKIVKDTRKVVRETLEPIEKLICNFATQARCGEVLAALQAQGRVEAVTTMGYDIEVTKKGTYKGRALAAVRDALNIPIEQVLAFGDSGNDLSMLDAVGCFIAPANATTDVLAMANRVVPSSKNDGVAVALEEIFA